MDQKKDPKEPLYFILENPTGTDHDLPSFTANVLKLIHALIEAKSTVKIRRSVTESLIGDRDLGAKYSVFSLGS